MRFFRVFKNFFADILSGRKLLWNLAKNDFKARFAGSFFGVVWSFVLPLVTILVLWFVFQVGFRSAPVENYPFILWLCPAFLSWNFFSDAFSACSNTFYDYAFLVKKIKFNMSVLPDVKILASLFVHVFFIVFIFVVYALYGVWPSISNIQVLYYLFCTISFLMALSYLISSLAVFVKDIGNIVNVVLQIGFWATPIVWDPGTISNDVIKVLKLNPLYYICIGYRDAFMDTGWFFNKPVLTLYFWVFTFIVFIIGVFVFQRTKSHFADVL